MTFYEFVSFDELSHVLDKILSTRRDDLVSYWDNKKVRVLGNLDLPRSGEETATLRPPKKFSRKGVAVDIG